MLVGKIELYILHSLVKDKLVQLLVTIVLVAATKVKFWTNSNKK